MASDKMHDALSVASGRASNAECKLIELKAKFTTKYGLDQMNLLNQLNELKSSLIADEKQLHLNEEEIHRNNEIIQQSYNQLQEVKSQLLLEERNGFTHYLDGEDFRLMVKKYFQELKLECLSLKNSLSTEQLWDRIIAPNYKLSTEQLRNIRNLFVKDLHFALNKNENKQKRSSLNINASLLYGLPNNNEHGIYYALDWSYDSFRVLRFEFNQHPSYLKHYETSIAIKSKHKSTKDYTELFDYIALTFKKFMINKFSFDIRKTNVYHIDLDHNIIKIPLEDDDTSYDDDDDSYDYRYSMGVHLNFPIEKKRSSINEAILKQWTHGYNIADVTGKDMIQLLQTALDKFNVPLRIDAMINDISIGTLLSAAFQKDGARTSLVLNAPLTAAYIEPKRNNEILSIELSSFDKALPRIPSTDIMMDSYSDNRGKGFAEKMITGKYLGELVRLLSLDVFGDKIKRYENKTLLNKRWGLKSSVVSQILEQFDSQNMQEIYRILRMDLGLQEFTGNDGKLFVQLCRVLVNRSVDLCSTLLLGILEKTQLFTKIKDKELYVLNAEIRSRKCFVGMDGEVWKIMARFHQRMRNTMQKIVNKKIADKIKLVSSFDGNGKGSTLAVIANNNYMRHQQYLQNQAKYD